jgi:hypothetical protein
MLLMCQLLLECSLCFFLFLLKLDLLFELKLRYFIDNDHPRMKVDRLSHLGSQQSEILLSELDCLSLIVYVSMHARLKSKAVSNAELLKEDHSRSTEL